MSGATLPYERYALRVSCANEGSMAVLSPFRTRF
jgi:hypothetical protein